MDKEILFLNLFSGTLPYRGEMRLCVIYPIPLSMFNTYSWTYLFLNTCWTVLNMLAVKYLSNCINSLEGHWVLLSFRVDMYFSRTYRDLVFKRLFFGNQRGEKKSISGRIFILYIIKHRQCSYSLLLSKIINLIFVT